MLRRNLIRDLQPLSVLTTLKELDVYDNEVKIIQGLETLTSLTYVPGRVRSGPSIALLKLENTMFTL